MNAPTPSFCHPWRRLARHAVLLAASAAAHAEPVAETDLKAAIVFNLAVFTEWPREALPAGAPIQLCVSSGNALLPALGTLVDKTVNGHRIGVRALGAPAAPRGCHVLVLGSADRERWPQLRHEIDGAAVLTVADERAIGSDGVIVSLAVVNRRIAFDVDLGAARSAHLTLSSKLLRLARSAQ